MTSDAKAKADALEAERERIMNLVLHPVNRSLQREISRLEATLASLYSSSKETHSTSESDSQISSESDSQVSSDEEIVPQSIPANVVAVSEAEKYLRLQSIPISGDAPHEKLAQQYPGTLLNYLLLYHMPQRYSDSEDSYIKQPVFYKEWLNTWRYPRGFVKTYRDALMLHNLAWKKELSLVEKNRSLVWDDAHFRPLLPLITECRSQFLSYFCDHEAVQKDINSFITRCMTRLPLSSDAINAAFDAYERLNMKAKHYPCRWKISRGSGKHVYLYYSTTAEALAEAGVVLLPDVSRRYDRFKMSAADYLPKDFQAPQDLEIPSLKKADVLIDAWLAGLSF